MTPRRREPARTYLVVNLLVLPGAGTFLGGRRAAGVAQALLAVAGFLLTTVWVWSWYSELFETGALPEGLGPRAMEGLAGIAMFVAGWIWGLASGLALRRAERAAPKQEGL